LLVRRPTTENRSGFSVGKRKVAKRGEAAEAAAEGQKQSTVIASVGRVSVCGAGVRRYGISTWPM